MATTTSKRLVLAGSMIDDTIKVDDAHFEYLRLQKGRLDSFAHDREIWHRVYQRDLWTSYTEMKPYLPERCWGILDIGSGLGGIDILLFRHYWSKTQITLMDGEDDPPRMELHRKTFNNMAVAHDFFAKNGVPQHKFGYCTPAIEKWQKPYAMIISLGSWCFHVEPAVYLDRIMATAVNKDTVLILDVRKDKPAWSQQLNSVLAARAVIRDSGKYQRTVYGVR